MNGRSTRANAPGPEVPAPIRDAWLRFHEAGWCQGVDAVFVFYDDGMEAWCLVEDEKSYRRFSELVEPLRASHRIELYHTRSRDDPKAAWDLEPPPSFWNNEELRTYFQGPLVHPSDPGGVTVRTIPENPREARITLRQQLFQYAEQVLDWSSSMERYARDLDPLASIAFEGSTPADARRQAEEICLQHAQEVDKLAQRLGDNLARAFPRTARRSRAGSSGKQPVEARSPLETVKELREKAKIASDRVYRFVHPRDHTVNLHNLREPSLLEQLEAVRQAAADLARVMRGAVQR